MQGLLGDFEDPRSQGLLGAALAMLASSGPSPQRRTFGSILGASGMEGMRQYDQARVLKQRDEELKRRNALVDLQLQQAAEAQRRSQEMRDILSQSYESPVQQAMAGGGGPTPENAALIPKMPGGFNLELARNNLLRGGNIEGAIALEGLREKAKSPLVTKPGDVLRDPENPARVLAQNPAEEKQSEFQRALIAAGYQPGSPEYVSMMRQLVAKQATHAPAVSVSYGAPFSAVGEDGPGYFRPPKDGGPAIAVTDRSGKPLRPTTEAKPMTDTQANANLYAGRMEKADSILRDLEGKYSRTWLFARQQAGEGTMGAIANSRLAPEAQMADQAQRDFLNAVLRRESGAVISPSEFANGRQQYFPQPGDTVEVIKQKERNRRTAIDGIKAAAGSAGQREREKGGRLRFNPQTGELE